MINKGNTKEMEKANSKTDLEKLKDLLPHGSNKKIAKKTGYTRVTVSGVLSGTIEINDTNIKIVEEAQKIAAASQKNTNTTLTNLNKFLSDSKA